MTVLPERYQPALGLYETQKAIGLIKNIFQVKLCAALHLKRVTAPLFVDPATGLNDDLNGVERPVGLDIPAAGHARQGLGPPSPHAHHGDVAAPRARPPAPADGGPWALCPDRARGDRREGAARHEA